MILSVNEILRHGVSFLRIEVSENTSPKHMNHLFRSNYGSNAQTIATQWNDLVTINNPTICLPAKDQSLEGLKFFHGTLLFVQLSKE